MNEALFVIRGPIGVGKSTVSNALRNSLSPKPTSQVETDLIKRMLDSKKSSSWRRNIAHDAAFFLTDKLLSVRRIPIVEIHTKYPPELSRYEVLARNRGVALVSILLVAPLSICIERATQRHVQGIEYDINEKMVRKYYCNLEPEPKDLVFDTSTVTVDDIVETIVANIQL